eukprot:CAMPEP_0172835546 /NCGR_PEP_ID=MMETSP1075-20121228/25848_1 /TAXON_ID=2916 /ORGANISM="Ceratium fusus, Strain PA161109" /LENGTH=61 /DNA_ID=CAMNT_0013678615 /DNA_START=347 /DNA_END=529 /DNA_ORIENTATION=-
MSGQGAGPVGTSTLSTSKGGVPWTAISEAPLGTGVAAATCAGGAGAAAFDGTSIAKQNLGG